MLHLRDLSEEMKSLLIEATEYDTWSLVWAARLLEETALKLMTIAQGHLETKE